MISGRRASALATCGSRVASETSPAPLRSALSVASSTAPPMPWSPPITSRCPYMPLGAAFGRDARRARLAGARRVASGTTCSSAGSAARSSNARSPQQSGPWAVNRPIFRPMKVTVRSALIATPRISPVSALSPEGMSTASTGRPLALIRRIAPAKGSRTAPPRPVPSSASTSTPCSSQSSAQGCTATPAASASAWALAASPESRAGSPTANTRTDQPARRASAAIR
ncbi:hypothetical protein D9M71_431960 [compost metagenome]